MESSGSPATHPQVSEEPARRVISCFGVFKKFGKSAWRKVGGSSKHERAHPQMEPPISTVMVDEDRENAPPHEHSGILEVDSKEPSVFDFEVTPTSFGNAAQRERMAALCARYGLPQQAESFQASSTNAPLRVSRSSRQRVRAVCHQCSTTFGSESSCPNCGHSKCSECRRQSITASPPSSIKETPIDVDESTHDALSSEVPDDRHAPVQPLVEKSKYHCHKCASEFATLTNSVCESCGHEKCNRCPRSVWHISDIGEGEPTSSTRQKRVYRPPKQRVRHYCDNCSEMFPARTQVCPSCLHKRCRSCTRRPHKRRKMQSEGGEDSETLRKVEERIANIEVPIASSSTAQEEASKS